MRVFSRFALVLLVLASPLPLLADVFQAECPLTEVASNPPASNFYLSPHGIFVSNGQVFALRGQTLTTYTTNDIGNLQTAREDFVGSMGSRESNGATVFSNGFLYVSSEIGLEVFDLRNVHAGGSAPTLISRTANLHYRRMAINGNLLAAVYPATDVPCAANGVTCYNSVDLFDITDPANPFRISSISAQGAMRGFNDVAFNYGFLIATGYGGTNAYDVTTPAIPVRVSSATQPGTFLASNGTNLIGVGNDSSILVYGFDPLADFAPAFFETISPALAIGRQNQIVFHPQATFDDAGGRLIAMVDERDPYSMQAARTIAFDVFDFSVPQLEGSAPRIYETVSMTTPDEVKWNPTVVGPYVYTVGELSGLQTWGACGEMTGRIELDSVTQLSCGGAEIHGWVTGTAKIANVELLLDGGSLGTVPVSGLPRPDVSSRTPALTWRVTVNLDQTSRGEHTLRLVATDVLGNQHQVASRTVFFPGAPGNCTQRRRQAAIHF